MKTKARIINNLPSTVTVPRHKTQVELLALEKGLGKLFKENDLRSGVQAGVYPVNTVFSVELTGQITIGKDFEKVQANRIDWESIALVALSKLNGVTVETVVNEAFKDGGQPAIKAEVKKIAESVKASARITCKGQVKVDGLEVSVY